MNASLGAAVILACLTVAAVGQWDRLRTLFPRHNPFADLDVNAQPTFVTPIKLLRVRADPAYCRTALATSSLQTRPLPDDPRDDGCGLENAVRIERGAVALSSTFVAACPLAVSFALFERHVAVPAALDHFQTPLRSLEHVGSYVCRNVRGSSQRRSDHAIARAVDIVSFTLQNGRRIRVTDWNNIGPSGEFLQRVRDGACRYFLTVLGPEYNAQHADHFHLRSGGFMACR